MNRIQRWFPRKTKIGHIGTLDPLATGVLVVCIGQATRLADYVQAMGKSYASRFRLGATSTSDDADGEIMGNASREDSDARRNRLGTLRLCGSDSASSASGVRSESRRPDAHDLVRKGKDVRLAARPVRIDAIRLLAYEWPYLEVEVDCRKGNAHCSIARDVGARFGCGGLVQTLRRRRVGPFTAEQGVSLDVDSASLKLLPMSAAVAGMEQARLNADDARRFRQGQPHRLAFHGRRSARLA